MKSPTCRNGHPYVDGSYTVRGRGRHCRQCERDRNKRWFQANSEARNARRRKPPRQTWINYATLAQARAMRDRGVTLDTIAATIGNGCSRKSLQRISKLHQWPVYKPPSVWMTDESLALARTLWDEGRSAEVIAKLIGNGCTKGAICGLVHRRKWPARPPAEKPAPSVLQTKKPPKKGRLTFTPKKVRKPVVVGIPILLREVYQRAAALDLPRTKRGDIDALNRAVRRDKPDHPGFVLADHKPTRVTWAI